MSPRYQNTHGLVRQLVREHGPAGALERAKEIDAENNGGHTYLHPVERHVNQYLAAVNGRGAAKEDFEYLDGELREPSPSASSEEQAWHVSEATARRLAEQDGLAGSSSSSSSADDDE